MVRTETGRCCGCWLIALLYCAGVESRASQTYFDQQHIRAVQQNPTGVVFTVRLKDGKPQFRQGELIRLELAFSSTVADTYTLDDAAYDRSGRLPSEQWFLDPADGAVDPLAEYYAYGSMEGGLRGMPTLTAEPCVIVVELNDWLRFDRPGKYRLYDTSTRIISQRDSSGEQREQPVTSNIIEFEILPRNKRWAKQALREAVRTLDKRDDYDERRVAASVVRFLDTSEAAHELLKWFETTDDDCPWEYWLGLVSSPHRTLILNDLENKLVEPSYSVSKRFFEGLVMLKFLSTQADPMPPYPDGKDEPKVHEWQSALQKRDDRQEQSKRVLWQMLLDALPEKRGPAREACAVTLLDTIWAYSPARREAPWPEPLERLRKELMPGFDQLSAGTQLTLLEYRWDWLKGPDFLPALRHLVAMDCTKTSQDGRLHNMALKRLNELSPKEGRALILQEIRNPKYGSDVRLLESLPDATLPEMDEDLVGNLEKSQGRDGYSMSLCSHLVGRYATGAVLKRVQKVYGDPSKGRACDIQAPLLNYFLRVAPDYGVERTEEAMAIESTGCRHGLLDDVANAQNAPLLKPIALEYLSNPDPEVAADAAKFLGRYGSPSAEANLRQRLQEFHSQWNERADEFGVRYGAKPGIERQRKLEIALVTALIQGAHWLSDKQTIDLIQPLCLTPESRSQVKSWSALWRNEMAISSSGIGEQEIWNVGQYSLFSMDELKAKLAQFPPGTVFQWRWTNDNDSDKRQRDELVAQQLQEFLGARDMHLKR